MQTRANIGHLESRWDVIVVGGGITGAGVLLEAARRGLNALLVERRDFAWGASSRSSKLVHGGLRYLAQGHIRLTRESVRERDRLLAMAPGLIDPQAFLLPHYRGSFPGAFSFGIALAGYDLLGGHWNHRRLYRNEALRFAPSLEQAGLYAAHLYWDATTDDCRLVLRLLHEAEAQGALALNYVAVESLLRRNGAVVGVRLRDELTGETSELASSLVVNATGAAASRLLDGGGPRLRPLRGSHLLLADWALPLSVGVGFRHPEDGRAVFAYPWGGLTLVGTTDLDEHGDLLQEPSVTPAEVNYLLAAARHRFNNQTISTDAIVSTFVGVRPVISRGALKPSQESREHAVWRQPGLVTVVGGKLTTFHPMAIEALQAGAHDLPAISHHNGGPLLPSAPSPIIRALSPQTCQRLAAHYGRHTAALVADATADDLTLIPGTGLLWAELRWMARSEAMMQLDDLMLRRTRLGLTLRHGAFHLLPAIRERCLTDLGWDAARWEREESNYRAVWEAHYSVPPLS